VVALPCNACLGKWRAQLDERKTLEALLASQRALAAELGDAAAYLRGQLPAPLAGPTTAQWRYLPSAQLGGDALGYQFLDPDHFAFFILDVCGHGVAAALHAISVMNLLRGGHLPQTDFRRPGEVLAALNPRFFMEDHHSLYFTIWYGVFNRKSRTLCWANGGHPPPLLFAGEPNTPPVLLTSPGGPAIGILPQGKWPERECTLSPEDQLFLFSDGLYEVRRGDGSMLDYDTWLKDLLNRFGNSLPNHDEILTAAASLGAMEDDVTVMTLKF
jgi:serine phosphatase RsbU (regulator of sigma subunit)